jgi:uncharacterized membrane protein HdeD (DUF308 family)
MLTNDSFKKLPVAWQAVMGIALVAVGAVVMLNASTLPVEYVYLFVGALFLLNGVPSLLEGTMTIIYSKKE